MNSLERLLVTHSNTIKDGLGAPSTNESNLTFAYSVRAFTYGQRVIMLKKAPSISLGLAVFIRMADEYPNIAI